MNEEVQGGLEGFRVGFPFPSSVLRAPSPSREKVLLRFLKQWIQQLRVNPACRMTWGWGESGRRNQFVKVSRYKRHDKNRFCTEAQSMNQSKINARSVSIQCTLHQQPMRIAPDFLMLGFSSTKTFTLCSIPLTPCHSARSRRQSRRIHTPRNYALSGCVEGSSLKNPLPLREK